MPEITVSGLGIDYGQTTVLHDVSFTVDDGELLTLLGPSGCGKTTTLMAIAGLTVPTRGSIRCGDDVLFDAGRRHNRPPERRDCGVVFQSYAIWPHMTVADNVAYPLKLRKVPKAEREERVADTLRLVGLDSLAARYPHELSGGQQQRVALARAIVYSPQVLLLDEPLSNLDAKLREQARAWLKDIQSHLGITTIFVTHDQDEALSMSDRIIVMNDGHIEQIGTPDEVYARPANPFVADFLGSSNLLRGRVVETAPEYTRVRLGDLGTTIRVTGSGPDAAGRANVAVDGGEVLVMVRPEDLILHEGAPDDPNAVPVRIVSRMFLGRHHRYVVEHAGQTFHYDSDTALTGETALLWIRPDRSRLFPASAAPATGQDSTTSAVDGTVTQPPIAMTAESNLL